MQVNDAFELGTTISAWLIYQQTIEVLSMTGLIVIPFAIVIWKNSREPSESQEEKAAWLTSINKMKWDFIVMAMVVTMAVLPARAPLDVSIDPDNASKAANKQLDEESARPPAWWQVLLGISAGINRALVVELPPEESLRAAISMTKEIQVTDPALRNELTAFRDDCYIPARGKLFQYARTGKIDVQDLKRQYGADAVSWMGGQGYQQTPGLYMPCQNVDRCGNTLRASQPVAGWPIQAVTTIDGVTYQRDVDNIYSVDHYKTTCNTLTEQQCRADVMPQYGMPFCSEWWTHPERGLRTRIVADQGITGRFRLFQLGALLGQLDTDEQDAIAKAALEQTPSSPISTAITQQIGQTRSDNPVASASNFLVGRAQALIGSVGTTLVYALMSLTASPLVQSLPIGQSYLLFALVVALPWMLFIGEYQLQGLWYASVAYFTIRFWTVLWSLVQWVDQKLLQLLLGTTSGGPITPDLLRNLVHPEGAQPVFALIEMMTIVMYLTIPLLFSGFMAVVGYRVGGAIGSVSSMGSSKLSSGASKSASMAESGLGSAGGKVLKK